MRLPIFALIITCFALVGFAFFAKGFFLNRVELSSKSNLDLDIVSALAGSLSGDGRSDNNRFLSHKVLNGTTYPHSSSQQPLTFGALRQKYSSNELSPINILSTLTSLTTSTISETPSSAAPQCTWFCRQYDELFYIVIDALRFDFLTYNKSLSNYYEKLSLEEHAPYVNRLPAVHSFLDRFPSYSTVLKFRADAPTVTMQRLKALMTGSLPTFIDIKDNFASTMIHEDNMMMHVHQNKHTSIMVGDDTWMGLVGQLISRAYPYPSFDVHDIDTVDQGCQFRIRHELCGRVITSLRHSIDIALPAIENIVAQDKQLQDIKQQLITLQQHLQLERDTKLSEYDKKHFLKTPRVNYTKVSETPHWFIAHFLGVDHVGHRFGPRHPLMDTKLKEMNRMIERFLGYISSYIPPSPATMTKDSSEHASGALHQLFTTHLEWASKYCVLDSSVATSFLPRIQAALESGALPTAVTNPKSSSPSTPRAAFLVLGDHGMTEGGNHGGSSSKETDAGLAFFSSIPIGPQRGASLSEHGGMNPQVVMADVKYPSSDALFNQLGTILDKLSSSGEKTQTHQDNDYHPLQYAKKITSTKLPLLSLLSSKSSDGDVEHGHDHHHSSADAGADEDPIIQQHEHSHDHDIDEIGTMGQIDLVPSLSLVMGIEIPYGNLGVLNKQLVPNPTFYQQLNGHQYGSQSDPWTPSMICSLFTAQAFPQSHQQPSSSSHGMPGEKVHIKVNEFLYETMILHLRVMNLGQMTRYANDYLTTVPSFSGDFVLDAFHHAQQVMYKIALIEDGLDQLHTQCSHYTNNTPESALLNEDELVGLIDALYQSILDTSKHCHIVMTHLKTGFTKEWTQFEMFCMYTAVIVLIGTVLIVFVVWLSSWAHLQRVFASLASPLRGQDLGQPDIHADTGIMRSYASDDDDDDDGDDDLHAGNHTRVKSRKQFSIIYISILSLALTLLISILPIFLFKCSHGYDLHIPFDIFNTEIITTSFTGTLDINKAGLVVDDPTGRSNASGLSNAGIGASTGADPHHHDTSSHLLDDSISTSMTAEEMDAYDVKTTYSLPIYLFFSAVYAMCFITLVLVTSIRTIGSLFTKSIQYIPQTSVFAACTPPDGVSFGFLLMKLKYAVPTLLAVAGLLHGLFSNSYISNEFTIMHTVTIIAAAWTVTAMYFQIYTSSHSQTSSSRDDQDGQSPSTNPTHETQGDMTQKKPIEAVGFRSTPLSRLPPFLLCLGVVLFVALPSLEMFLSLENANQILGVQNDSPSIISGLNQIFHMNDYLTTNFHLNVTMPRTFDEFLDIASNFSLSGSHLLSNQQTQEIEHILPSIVQGLKHQGAGDHHGLHHEHHHQHDHQSTDQQQQTNVNGQEPTQGKYQQGVGPIDPVQVTKTALNMFSPDIALDQYYVRQEERYIVIPVTAATSTTTATGGKAGAELTQLRAEPFTYTMLTPDEYQQHLSDSHLLHEQSTQAAAHESTQDPTKTEKVPAQPRDDGEDMLGGFFFYPYSDSRSSDHHQASTTRGTGTGEAQPARTIIYHEYLYDISIDPRSHFTFIHVVAILLLFYFSIYLLMRWLPKFSVLRRLKQLSSQPASDPSIQHQGDDLHPDKERNDGGENADGDKPPSVSRLLILVAILFNLYRRILFPISAIFVTCYWVPTLFAAVITPILSFMLNLFGTCEFTFTTLMTHQGAIAVDLEPLGSSFQHILSRANLIQVCSNPSTVTPLVVNFVRSYIPMFVYIISILGLVLFVALLFSTRRSIRGAQAKQHNANRGISTTPASSESSLTPPNMLYFVLLVYALYPTICLVNGPRSTVAFASYVVLISLLSVIIRQYLLPSTPKSSIHHHHDVKQQQKQQQHARESSSSSTIATFTPSSVIWSNHNSAHFLNLCILQSFITICLFHTTGHAYSFNDVHVASGFVGIPCYIFGVSEILVVLNTFGSIIMSSILSCLLPFLWVVPQDQYDETYHESCDQLSTNTPSGQSIGRHHLNQNHSNSSDDDQDEDEHHPLLFNTKTSSPMQTKLTTTSIASILPSPNSAVPTDPTRPPSQPSLFTFHLMWLFLWWCLRFLCCTLNVFLQRRDLFVWAVYTPKYLFEAGFAVISLLLATLLALLAQFGL